MAVRIFTTSTAGAAVDVTRLVPSITWSGDYLQCARTLEFGLLSSPTDKNIPATACSLGGGVLFAQDEKTLFSGWIFQRQKSTSGSVIAITAYDRGFYLKRNEAVYKFTNMSPEDITRRVCADFGISVGNIAKTGVKVSRNFIGVSLYKIIQTAYTLAAETTGEAYQVRFEGDALSVIKKGVSDETLILAGESNLMSASTTESVADMVNQVVIYDKNDNPVGTKSDTELIKLYGLLQSYVKQTEGENAEAKAKKILADKGVSQKITVENLGNIACVTGNAVAVQEPYTGIYGLFYIDADTHTWKNGQYYNKLTLNFKRIMDEQEAGALPNASGKGTASSGGTSSGGTWEYINKPG